MAQSTAVCVRVYGWCVLGEFCRVSRCVCAQLRCVAECCIVCARTRVMCVGRVLQCLCAYAGDMCCNALQCLCAHRGDMFYSVLHCAAVSLCLFTSHLYQSCHA